MIIVAFFNADNNSSRETDWDRNSRNKWNIRVKNTDIQYNMHVWCDDDHTTCWYICINGSTIFYLREIDIGSQTIPRMTKIYCWPKSKMCNHRISHQWYLLVVAWFGSVLTEVCLWDVGLDDHGDYHIVATVQLQKLI